MPIPIIILLTIMGGLVAIAGILVIFMILDAIRFNKYRVTEYGDNKFYVEQLTMAGWDKVKVMILLPMHKRK